MFIWNMNGDEWGQESSGSYTMNWDDDLEPEDLQEPFSYVPDGPY